jgi:hypothetical protein
MEIENEAKYMNLRQAGGLMRGYTQLEQTKEYREKTWLFPEGSSPDFGRFYAELARHLLASGTTEGFIS